MITVSTITPVYKGEEFLPDLVKRIEKTKQKWEKKFNGLELVESIFVIDGANDNSLKVLQDIAKEKDWIRVIELSRNFGQHPATIAGILHSTGEWIVTLDEDLQHDPNYIDELLRKVVDENNDICYALALTKTHNSFVRDKFSKFFKNIVSYLSGEPNVKKFNSFRIIRGSVARASAAIASHETYYDIVLCWFTNKIITHRVSMEDIRNTEGKGESGYSFMQLIKHGKRMIMTSKVKFLRIGILIGVLAFTFSIVLSMYALYSKFSNPDVSLNQGWTSTILTVIFFGGLSSLLTGFLLESVSDILLTSKGKPTFFVVDRTSDVELENILKSSSTKE